MTQEELTIYRCGHCRKMYQMKYACERHERRCWKNPANQYACFDCVFLNKDRETIDGGMSSGLSVRTFRCTKLEKDMHTVIAVVRRLECVDHTELMPLQCEHRKTDMDDFFHEVESVLNTTTNKEI
jgi:hypothetical protein